MAKKFRIQFYTDIQKARLLDECSQFFLKCLLSSVSQDDKSTISLYDIFYHNYCKKFESEKDHNSYEPFYSSDGKFFKEQHSYDDIWASLRVLGIIFSGILIFMYYVGIYFSVFDVAE